MAVARARRSRYGYGYPLLGILLSWVTNDLSVRDARAGNGRRTGRKAARASQYSATYWALETVGCGESTRRTGRPAAQRAGASKSWELRRKKGKVCVREHSNARRVRKEGKSVTEHTATREREGSVRRGQNGQRDGQQSQEGKPAGIHPTERLEWPL